MSVSLPKPQPIKPLDTQVDHTISFIPKTTFMALLIAAKGCSKSTTTLNAFTNPQLLAKRFNRIILISPTASLDDKMKILQEHPIVKVNKPLLKAKWAPKPKTRTVYTVCGQRQVKDPVVKMNFSNLPDYIPMEPNDYIEDFSVSTILGIFNEQHNDIIKYGKDISNKVCVILDDTAGLRQWNDPKMINALFKCRHTNVSFWVTSQDAAAIPKKARDNMDLVMIFALGNKDTVYKMSRECACGLDWDMWYKLYLSVIQEPYAFLGVNRINPLGYKFTHSFIKFLEYPDTTKLALEQMKELTTGSNYTPTSSQR